MDEFNFDFDPDLQIDMQEYNQELEAQMIWLKKQSEERKKEQKRKEEELTDKKHEFQDFELERIEKKAEENASMFLLDKYMYCYKASIIKNDTLGKISMHYILGALLRNKQIPVGYGNNYLDYRIHIILIQISGSGKGETAKYVQRILKDVGYPTFDIKSHKLNSHDKWRIPDVIKSGSTTPAGLVNSYKVDKKTGEIKVDKNGIEQINKGSIEQYDFFIYEEGGHLFNNSEKSNEMIDIFLTAMEPIGSSNNIHDKKLKDYAHALPTKSYASYFFMTRPIGKTKKTIADSGLFQRCLFLPREIEYEVLTDMRITSMKNKIDYAAGIRNKKDMSFYEDLLKEIKQVVEFSYNNEIELNPSKRVLIKDFIEEKFRWFEKDLNDSIVNDDIKGIMHSFKNRYGDNMLKLSYHSACIRYSKYVDLEDFQYAFNILRELYEEQKEWLIESIELNYRDTQQQKDFQKILTNIVKLDRNGIKSFHDIACQISYDMNLELSVVKKKINKFLKGKDSPIYATGEGDGKKLRII